MIINYECTLSYMKIMKTVQYDQETNLYLRQLVEGTIHRMVKLSNGYISLNE